MTAKTAVTTAQLEQVRKMAKEKGIGKGDFQRGLDDGIVATMLDQLKPAPPKKVEPLLTELSTITIVPSVDTFSAADHFGPSNPAGIKFYLGDNFKTRFLNKIEKNLSSVTLALHRLERNSRDEAIRKELGPKREETTLVHLYELIRLQPQGQPGKLLTNGWANIFYIRDDQEVLWAVGVYWGSDDREWDVRAGSVEGPIDWDAGSQVGSRK